MGVCYNVAMFQCYIEEITIFVSFTLHSKVILMLLRNDDSTHLDKELQWVLPRMVGINVFTTG